MRKRRCRTCDAQVPEGGSNPCLACKITYRRMREAHASDPPPKNAAEERELRARRMRRTYHEG